jgi:hypothetical protein
MPNNILKTNDICKGTRKKGKGKKKAVEPVLAKCNRLDNR